jgi:HK97 family phage prohead protease
MPQIDRAYSTFEVKSISEDMRTITGIASTPSTDRMDDIVEPKGAQFKLPIPMLWQHDSRQPVGHVTAAKVTTAGIQVTCQFAKVDEPPSLKDDLDRAWAMVKSGLVRGFSIGFNALESVDIEGTWGRRFTKWDWLELSAVTIPANADCSIQTIKTFDDRSLLRQKGVVRLPPKKDTPEARAATGPTRKGVVRLADPPGASGLSKRNPP